MKETRDILAAAQRNRDVGNRTALATVVGVEGSSYRRPGARMLVSEDAQTAGGVSGGGLERDGIEHALAVIRSGACKLITYDTTQDDDLVYGTRLGCRGLVRVFIEPITDLQLAMLNILADVSRTGEPIVCATLLDATGPSADASPMSSARRRVALRS